MNKLTAIAFSLLIGVVQADLSELEIQVSQPIYHAKLPSGSGMVAYQQKLYVVGDDSPYLFTLDTKYHIKNKLLLKPYPIGRNGRIAHTIKPDYEAMSLIMWDNIAWNFIVGSGSKVGDRDFAYLIAIDKNGPRFERKLTSLYEKFHQKAGFLPTQMINIEALAVADPHIYFFNRGNSGSNVIFQIGLRALVHYMMGKVDDIGQIKAQYVKLPRISRVEAGFSGADFWLQTKSFVYTASVEKTNDAYSDGAILGSFVGLLPLTSLYQEKVLDLTLSAKKLMRGRRAIITKVESVALTHMQDDSAKGVLVSDNDDGTSEFFRIALKLKKR